MRHCITYPSSCETNLLKVFVEIPPPYFPDHLQENFWLPLDVLLSACLQNMSSRQDSDQQYQHMHSAWLASQSQRDMPDVGGLSGYGLRHSEFEPFTRSAIPLAAPRQLAPSVDNTVDYVVLMVTQADQETLLRSRNKPYLELLAQHNATKLELAALKYVLVSIFIFYLTATINGRRSCATEKKPPGLPRRSAPYKKSELPHINFYTRKNYDDSKPRNVSRVEPEDEEAEKGLGQLGFLEHEDGTIISG